MIQQTNFIEYAVLSIPNQQGMAIKLNNEKILLKIATDDKNMTAFMPKEENRSFEDVYENILPTKIPTCIKAIFNLEDKLQDTCGQIQQTTQESTSFLREDLVVIQSQHPEKTWTNCDGEIEKLKEKFSLIKFTGCSILTEGGNLTGRQQRSIDLKNDLTRITNLGLTPPDIEIKPHFTDPRIQEIRSELDNTLAGSWNWIRHEVNWQDYGLEAGVLIMITIIIITLRIAPKIAVRTNRALQTDNIELSNRDRIPASWVREWMAQEQSAAQA